MAIPEHIRQNFQTLLNAVENNDVALLECTDKQTGEPVYTVVAVTHDGDEYILTPFARMFSTDPYEELNPPEGS